MLCLTDTSLDIYICVKHLGMANIKQKVEFVPEQGLKVYVGVEADIHSLMNPTPDDECFYVLGILFGGERVSNALLHGRLWGPESRF